MIDNISYIFTQRNKVRQHLRNNHYDIIHIHTSREFLFLKDILLAKMIKSVFDISVVMTIHVGTMDTVYNRIGWFKRRSINILNKYVSKTIFLSKVMRNDFIKFGMESEKTAILYNFHNFIKSNSTISTNQIPQLLFVGALHREKGILELLKALLMLPDFKFHLYVCGKLTDKSIAKEIDDLKTSLADKSTFLGYITGEEKTKLFRKSDILILPSYHEGLPLVIMEALGEGCAIMSTKVGAIPEILTDENCLWLEIASIASIIEKFDQLDMCEIVKIKENNRQLGKQYSFESHVDKLCNLYISVI